MSEILLKMYIGLHVKYRFLWARLIKNLNFLDRFLINIKISNHMQICPKGNPICPMLTDGRTDGRIDRHDEGISRFSLFLKHA
jgi:hypothetical protein